MSATLKKWTGWLRRAMSWPSEILKTLKSIDSRLDSIEQAHKKLDRCMDDRNHRHQMCVKTGHWNDPSPY